MTTKITVSLPDEQVAALKAAVRAGEARSVSALVARRLSEGQATETYDAFLARFVRDSGATADDLAWAEHALDGA